MILNNTNNINDRIDTEEDYKNFNYTQQFNTSSSNFKKYNINEEKNKNEISTYLMGKTLGDLKSYNFNYFLAKKPKTSYLIKRSNDNPRMINPNSKSKFVNSGLYGKNNEDNIENIEKKNRLFSNSNVVVEDFINNEAELNKTSRKGITNEEVKSPWNMNKHTKKNSAKVKINNTPFINDINNRNEIEGKKNIYLPNLSNYDSNIGIKNIGESIKFNVNQPRKEFNPLQTNSNFFFKNMKNTSLVSLKQKEHLDFVVKEKEFKFSSEYFDSINKKIMLKKKPMTSISIKPKRLGVKSVLSGQLDNATSYKLIDEYLKKREIFG